MYAGWVLRCDTYGEGAAEGLTEDEAFVWRCIGALAQGLQDLQGLVNTGFVAWGVVLFIAGASVFKVFAPRDAIAYTGGRCDQEAHAGKLAGVGDVGGAAMVDDGDGVRFC